MNARRFAVPAILLAGTFALTAQELVIQSFEPNGTITFSAVSNATEYVVREESGGEWTPLVRIHDAGGSSVTASVSMAEASNLYCVKATLGSTGDFLYLVIDLSDGASATSYPVHYLPVVPAGGWTEEHRTTKLVLRRVPAGTYMMGSPSEELGRNSDETQHQVTLTQDFYIGVFEVTQEQWYRVMGDWPSYFNNVSYRDSRPVEQVTYDDIRGSSAGAGWPGSSAVDAGSFMGRLREKTGLNALDLPTESQWEYACRAGTITALNSRKNLTSTESDPAMDEVGRYRYNGGEGFSQGGDTTTGTARVGSYLPNRWGLYDMHGNVREWCLDWYGTYPGTVVDPPGAASGSLRVVRAGCWHYFALTGRSANRGFDYPSHRYSYAGFRVAKTRP